MERVIAIVLKFVDQASKPMQETAKGVSSFAGSIKNKITELAEHARWASAFIGAAFSKMVKDALSLAAEFEKVSVAGEYLLGSAEAADKFAASIRKVAEESIFGIDQIADLSKRLIGNTKDAERSETALRALIDAVAATGGGYQELESSTRAWIQTNAKAKASSEELNRQFANANIPVLRVLAESIVKDLDHPLRKYLVTAGEATGATKTQTKAFESANAQLPELKKGLESATKRLDELKEKGKEGTSTFLSAEKSIMSYNRRIGEAEGKITSYNSAQESTNKTMVKAKLTVEDVMAQLQGIGDLDIPGSIAADAITRALNEAYGGANQKLVDSFSGQLEKLQDKLRFTVLAFLGLDESFRVIEGSIFDRLKGALMALNNFLDNNREQIEAFGRALGQSLPFMIGLALFAIGLFAGAIVGILGPVLELAAILGGIGAAIGLIITAFVDLSPIMGGVEKATDQYGNKLEDLKGKMSLTEEASKKLQEQERKEEENRWTLKRATETLRTFTDLLKTSIDNVKRAFELALDPTGQFKLGLDDLAAIITLILSPIAMMIQLVAQAVLGWRAMYEGIAGVWDLLRGRVDEAAQHMENLAAIQEESMAGWERFGQSFDTWTTAAANAFANVNEKMIEHRDNWVLLETDQGTVLRNMATGVQQNFGYMSVDIDTATKNMDENVNTTATNMSTQMSTNVGNMSTLVGSDADGFPYMQSTVETAMSSMVKATEDNLPTLVKQTEESTNKSKGFWGNLVDTISSYIKKVQEATTLRIGPFSGSFFQHGGLVPGQAGQAVPIIAHAGERIIPANGADVFKGGGGSSSAVNITFSGPVNMDSETRVQELADRIGRILGRQNELARYGAGF